MKFRNLFYNVYVHGVWVGKGDELNRLNILKLYLQNNPTLEVFSGDVIFELVF
jgi:hypothetical protein